MIHGKYQFVFSLSELIAAEVPVGLLSRLNVSGSRQHLYAQLWHAALPCTGHLRSWCLPRHFVCNEHCISGKMMTGAVTMMVLDMVAVIISAHPRIARKSRVRIVSYLYGRGVRACFILGYIWQSSAVPLRGTR